MHINIITMVVSNDELRAAVSYREIVMHRLIMICIFHYCVYLESKSQSFEVIITINFNPKCIHRIEMSRPKSKGGMLLLLLIHSKSVFARWKSVGLGPVTIHHPPLVNRAVHGTSRNFTLRRTLFVCC